MRRVIVALAGAAAGIALMVGAKGFTLAGTSRDPATDPATAPGGAKGGRNCAGASPSASLRTPPTASRSAKVTTRSSSRARSRPSPASSSPAAGGPSAQATRVVTGPVVNHRYGPVQVRVVASGDRILDVTALRLPSGRMEAYEINGRAEPKLRREALIAQSATIDTVSGATLTSRAYRASLQAALDAAAIGTRCS